MSTKAIRDVIASWRMLAARDGWEQSDIDEGAGAAEAAVEAIEKAAKTTVERVRMVATKDGVEAQKTWESIARDAP